MGSMKASLMNIIVSHEGKDLFYKLRTPVLKNAWKNTTYFHGSLIKFSTTKFNTRSLIVLLAMCDPCVPVGVSYSTLIYLPARQPKWHDWYFLDIDYTSHVRRGSRTIGHTLRGRHGISYPRTAVCEDIYVVMFSFIIQVGFNYLIRLCFGGFLGSSVWRILQ